MNRTVSTIVKNYRRLIPEIESALRRNHVAYLVTDDGFAGDAQVWTPKNRREMLALYARQSNEPYKESLKRITDEFERSGDIHHIDRADLAEIKRLTA